MSFVVARSLTTKKKGRDGGREGRKLTLNNLRVKGMYWKVIR